MRYVDCNIPTLINNGGCAIFAKMLSEHLTKYGIPHKIIFLVDDNLEDNIQKVRNENFSIYLNNIREKKESDEDICCSHCITQIDDYYLDSEGIVEDVDFEKFEVSYDELVNIIRDSKHWSDVFDHSCIPKIQEYLDKAFKKIAKEENPKFVISEKVPLTKHTHHEAFVQEFMSCVL
jgi:hypothetical protein